MSLICDPLYDMIEEVEDMVSADMERAGEGPLERTVRPPEAAPVDDKMEQSLSSFFRPAGSVGWVGRNTFIRTRFSSSVIRRFG